MTLEIIDMPEMRRFLIACFSSLAFIGLLGIGLPQPAQAEIFYCQSTRGPNGSAKYCNFLLFDTAFTRHRQIIVAQGAQRRVPLNGRYDLFCVLVQNTQGVPDNIAYRKQQCQTTDTGREYKVPLRALNMRRGRDGYSTNAVASHLPDDSW